MSDNIKYIRSITEETIPELADKVFSGLLDETLTFDTLFMKYIPLLEKELEKRRADKVMWLDASGSYDVQKLNDYVETYDNEAPEYRGKHLDEANQLITLIENDDKEWNDAKSKDTIEAYKHYLGLYDKPKPSYRGKHVDRVRSAIKAIKDKEDWIKAKETNTIRSYSDYLSVYDKTTPEYAGEFIEEAKLAISNLEDDADWLNSCNINSIESYESYLKKYDGSSPAYRGKYIEAANRKIQGLLPPPPPDPRIADEEAVSRLTPPDPRVEDDAAWSEATRLNTIDGFRQYLNRYNIHANEAELAIRHLIDEEAKHKEEEDWSKARAENTLNAYKRFIDKYETMSDKYMSMHLPEAKKKIKELTPQPTPIKWKKWLLIVLALALCWFLWIQWQDNDWPFNPKPDKKDEPVVITVENIDSLQWAIDNHNIPMLEKYAELDSVRAYYPLADALFAIRNDEYDTFGKWIVKAFNSPDSIQGRELWNRYALPIVDGLTKSVKESFDSIDYSNSDYAEKRCLEIYSVYVTNIDSSLKLLQHPQRIIPLENKALDYISSWESLRKQFALNGNKLSSEGNQRYKTWKDLNTQLEYIINNSDAIICTNYYKMKYDENK